MPKKIVAVVSGGMDSVTMLHDLVKKGNIITVLSFDYEQRHKKELLMMKWNCKKLGIEYKIIKLGKIMSNSCLTDPDKPVPHGHYESKSMKLTVVPNRNMVMLSVAISYAISCDFEAVAYAAHSGDHAIYPDCRPEFVQKIKALAKVVHYFPVDILTPYLALNKGTIIARGLKIGVDYSKTWTCYEGKEKICGKCGSCQERLEGFKQNGIKDPLQ